MDSNAPKLTPCFVLVPLAYNDGSPVQEQVIEGVKDDLFIQFGGYTVEGVREGAYRRQDTGEKQIETTLKLRVDVSGIDGVEALRAIVVRIGESLGQECMHFEVGSASSVELVATKRKGGA